MSEETFAKRFSRGSARRLRRMDSVRWIDEHDRFVTALKKTDGKRIMYKTLILLEPVVADWSARTYSSAGSPVGGMPPSITSSASASGFGGLGFSAWKTRVRRFPNFSIIESPLLSLFIVPIKIHYAGFSRYQVI